MILFFVAVAGLGAVLAPVLIPFFFSNQYAGAVPLAQLLLLVGIPRAIAVVMTRVQEAQKEKAKLYSINLTYAVVEIVALVVLTPMFGMNGLVIAKGISNTTYLGMALWSLR